MPTGLDSQRLNTLCIWMARAAGLLAVGIMATATIMWLHPDYVVEIARDNKAMRDGPMTLSLQARLVSAIVSCAHLGLLCWALWTAKGRFESFARGEVLEEGTGRDLRIIGGLLVAYALLAPLKGSMITVAVTMGNPPGQRLLSVGLSSNEMILGVFGALILVLGHVMAEAARIADDNRQIV